MGSPFRHRFRVRYGECDPQGIVFNANYLLYLDTTLTELWREAFGSYGEMVERGADMVVAETMLRFRAPAVFDEQIDHEVTVAHLGTTSLVTEHRLLRRNGVTVLEATMRHVFVDPTAMTKLAMPAWVREGLGRYAPHGEAAPA